MSTGRVKVSSPSRFRVVDGTGVELAAGGAGEWTVEPVGVGVRLVPPDSYRPQIPQMPPAEPVETPVVIRRAGRVMTASTTSPDPTPAPWAVAAALVAVAGGATATLGRRRQPVRDSSLRAASRN